MVELKGRRDVLLAARQNIVRELDQVRGVRANHWGYAGSDSQYQAIDKLRGMLLEIDLELAHSAA